MSRDPRDPRDPRVAVADPRRARSEIVRTARGQVARAGQIFLEALLGTNARAAEIVVGAAAEVRDQAEERRKARGDAPHAWNFGDEPERQPGDEDAIDVEGVAVDDEPGADARAVARELALPPRSGRGGPAR